MVSSSTIFLMCLFFDISESKPDDNKKKQPITIPYELNRSIQFENLLGLISKYPNLTVFTKSPRKNNLTDVPTTIVLKISLKRIEDFDEEKHELKMDVDVTYLWSDERIKTNKTMRLKFATLQSSQFWRPDFSFKNATIAASDYQKTIFFKNQVLQYNKLLSLVLTAKWSRVGV